jgi:hypothetical protein
MACTVPHCDVHSRSRVLRENRNKENSTLPQSLHDPRHYIGQNDTHLRILAHRGMSDTGKRVGSPAPSTGNGNGTGSASGSVRAGRNRSASTAAKSVLSDKSHKTVTLSINTGSRKINTAPRMSSFHRSRSNRPLSPAHPITPFIFRLQPLQREHPRRLYSRS